MYKAKVEEKVFEFEFSDAKALEGFVNGQAFKIDLAHNGAGYHVLFNHRSYTIELVRFDKEAKTCVLHVNNKELVVSKEKINISCLRPSFSRYSGCNDPKKPTDLLLKTIELDMPGCKNLLAAGLKEYCTSKFASKSKTIPFKS